MSRRDFRTPASLPVGTTGRCIVVPDNAQWLGLLNAALLMLTERWRYDQVEPTDLTPEETAAIWYDIYVSTLTSDCEDCPDMNCNDVLACMLPYLEASFYEDADIRLNPVTNAPQVSYDGGTTWSDIPQSGNGTINAPQPTPTSGANDAAKICLASSRAALVIAEFYKQSFGAFTADLYNALGTANTFLQDVKMVLFNAIYSPYDGILEAAGFLTQDFETNYTAAELSSGALEDLLCLLVTYASVDASGVVTFDYGAVRDNVIADVGINPGTALWFLLGNMQEAGLNTAGSVRITDSPLDCVACYDVLWHELDLSLYDTAACDVECAIGDNVSQYETDYIKDNVVGNPPPAIRSAKSRNNPSPAYQNVYNDSIGMRYIFSQRHLSGYRFYLIGATSSARYTIRVRIYGAAGMLYDSTIASNLAMTGDWLEFKNESMDYDDATQIRVSVRATTSNSGTMLGWPRTYLANPAVLSD